MAGLFREDIAMKEMWIKARVLVMVVAVTLFLALSVSAAPSWVGWAILVVSVAILAVTFVGTALAIWMDKDGW